LFLIVLHAFVSCENGHAAFVTLSFVNNIFFRHTTSLKPKNEWWREDGAIKLWYYITYPTRSNVT
jgi:uncharacterized membrane protein